MIPLHNRTKEQLTASKDQSCIIIAPNIETADRIANNHVASDTVHVINEPGETISIDSIRSIKSTATLSSKAKQTFVLYGADNFTIEAQNAFLKILEEPSSTSRFVIAASTHHKLLRTVQSRCNIVELVNPTQSDIDTFLEQLSGSSEYQVIQLRRLLSATNNNFGFLVNVVETATVDNQLQYIDEVKSYLQMTTYEKLTYIHKSVSDADQAKRLLTTCLAVYGSLISNSSKKQQIDHFVDNYKHINNAYADIEAKSSYKASLFRLSYQI